jgi:hypothetical protein
MPSDDEARDQPGQLAERLARSTAVQFAKALAGNLVGRCIRGISRTWRYRVPDMFLTIA